MSIRQNRNASSVKSYESKRCLPLAFIAVFVVGGGVRSVDAAVLFSIDRDALPWPNLVTLDTVAGTVTVVGPLNQSVTQTDLAVANGKLYAVDTNSNVSVHLMEISTQTGAVLSWCPVYYLGSPLLTDAEGLAQAGGNLYIAFRIPGGGAGVSVSHAVGELQPCAFGVAVIVPSTVIDYQPFFAGVDIDGMTALPCGLTPFPGNPLLGVDHDPTVSPQQHTYMTLSSTIGINGVFADSPVAQAVNDLVFCGGDLFGIDHGTNQVSLHDPSTGEILTYPMSYSAASSMTGLAGRDCCVDAPNNMVAWWPLDEDTQPMAQDIVGGNHGSHVNGPVPLLGEVVDNSLCFDGAAQYVNVASAAPLNPGPDFTIDAWVLADNVTPVMPIVDKRSAVPQGYQLFVSNGRLGFQMADAIGNNCNCGAPNSVCSNYVAPTADITLGVWHHVAVTVSRSGTAAGELFVDGNSVHSFTPRAGPLANGANLWIGRAHTNPCGGAAYWKGCIDEVEFFDRALTVDEIRSIRYACRAGKCKPGCCQRLPPPADRTCTTMWDMECLEMGGIPVTPCLGDLDSNGVDDACECDLVDDGGGTPSFCDGLCPVSAVTEECAPRCVNYNPPPVDQTMVTECDCRDTNTCRVLDIGIGEPDCANACDPTTICMKTRIVLGDGTINICCDCVPSPPTQREFTFETLPESAGTTASEVFGHDIRVIDLLNGTKETSATGRVRDASGVWHAAAWSQEGNSPWGFELLPVAVADPPVDSVARSIRCASGVCYAVGSVGDSGSEQFTIWKNSGGGWGIESLAAP